MQEASRLPWLIPVRHARMASNVLSYYRGSPVVMAWDLGNTQNSNIEVQLCGDCHLGNFGFYASPELTLQFDINDFDETAKGPFDWDVKRLVVSMILAARVNDFPEEAQARSARSAVRAYRKTIQQLASESSLQAWGHRIDVKRVIREMDHPQLSAHLKKLIAKARNRNSREAASKLCETSSDGELRIRHLPPLIWRHELLDQQWTENRHWREHVDTIYQSYLASVRAELRHFLTQMDLVDVAIKAVGVGSVGTRCAIALFRGREHEDDLLMMQSKEAEASVLAPYATSPSPVHHGQRVVEGQRLMQTTSDPCLGWTSTTGERRHYYWRLLRNWKGSVDVANLDARGLELYGSLCGRVLAKAHARSGSRRAIAAYLGEGKSFDRAMLNYAFAYADQNETDYAAFMQAIYTGRLISDGINIEHGQAT